MKREIQDCFSENGSLLANSSLPESPEQMGGARPEASSHERLLR